MFAEYGWEVTPEWASRYHKDPWVFHLTNALLNEHRRYLDLLNLLERDAPETAARRANRLSREAAAAAFAVDQFGRERHQG